MALLWIAALVIVYELFKRGVYLGVRRALREEGDRLADNLAEAMDRRK